MSLIQEVVEMDGKKYLLTDREENISAAKADLKNLRLYISRSSNGTEIIENDTVTTQSKILNDPLRFGMECTHDIVWDKQSERFFMRLLLEESDKYWNPRVKKRAFWELIRSRFVSEYGKGDASADTFAKKLANLKRRYTNIRNSPPGSLKPWHLLANMEEFFKNDETFSAVQSISSMEFESTNDISRVNSSAKEDCNDSSDFGKFSQDAKQLRNDFYYKQKKVTQEIEREKLRLIQASIDKAEARAVKRDERAKLKLEFLKKYHEDHIRLRERELKVEEERNELLRRFLARERL